MARNKRFDVIVDALKGYDTVLDIGTDHGLVLKKAFEKKYIQRAIASDLRIKPLHQAKQNLIPYPVVYQQSDGFLNIKDMHYDCVIIAGMGGHLIKDILANDPNQAMTYLLQPNDREDLLRSFLSENGYKIVDEWVVFEVFYYIIMKVVRKKEILDFTDVVLGPVLKTKKTSLVYYQYKLHLYEQIYAKASDIRKEAVLPLIQIYQKGIQFLEG